MRKLVATLALYLGLISCAFAQVGMGGMFPGPGTAHSASVGPPTVSFIAETHAGASFSGNSVVYAGASIGTASSDRFLIAGWTDIQSGVGNAVAGVTLKVAGQSDIAMTFTSLANANGTNVIAWAAVPAAYGTTGDLWLTTAAGFANTPALATYTTLISTLVSTTPTTTSQSSSSATSINNSITTSAGGFIVVGGVTGIATGGAGSYNSPFGANDANATFSGGIHSFNHANSVSGPSTTVTYNQAGTADQMLFVAAAWR